ncbi:MAG: molybdopterin-dependent oxidoreductase [Verrucomicrobiota bacterium]|nr:molybdopterin-dependent oxidoreductase [Verrucomicrobiota bacterium]
MNSETRLDGGKLFGYGILSGALAGVVMTTVMLLLASLFDVATPLVLLGDRISAWLPVGPFLNLMGTVGGYNHMKQLGVSSTIISQIVLGAIGVWIYVAIAQRGNLSRGSRQLFAVCLFILLPLIASAALLWPVLGTHYSGLPMVPASAVTLVGLLVAFVAFEQTAIRAFAYLSSARKEAVARPDEFTPSVGRRAFVLGGVGGLLALGSAGMLRRFYKLATFSYDGTMYRGKDVQAITPNDKFYCVTKNVVDPKVNPALWRLEIDGMVGNKRTFTLPEIKAMPSVTQETTLMCISNEVGAGLMSNAVWKGVPLRALLEEANVDPNGKKVLLHGVDNYTDTFPLEKAMNPTTLVVYEMNGEPLPDRHGAPARMIVPGYFGEKHVKWITRIEVTGEESTGFYEKQGWGPDFIVPTRSRFDQPDDNAKLSIGEMPDGIPLKGVAFAGDRGVTKVEVSSDDGKNWAEAKIDYPGTKLTWVLWSYVWKPEAPGDYKLVVRATDSTGAVQQFDEKRNQYSGKTGLHKIAAQVSA